ncbi:MAG: phage holin family protein [Microbacteriaceae bacterium]
MQSFLGRLIINAVALWITTLIVVGGVEVKPFANDTTGIVLTYLIVALIFGVVNSVVGNFIRIVAFPLYILTLGLLALVVNSLLLLIVHWISGLLGFGLVVNGFWWGVLVAVVLSFFSWLLTVLLRPVFGGRRKK